MKKISTSVMFSTFIVLSFTELFKAKLGLLGSGDEDGYLIAFLLKVSFFLLPNSRTFVLTLPRMTLMELWLYLLAHGRCES